VVPDRPVAAARDRIDAMPRSWVYMLALLVVCLIASMVIAAIRLI
jgi:hypothetical protein